MTRAGAAIVVALLVTASAAHAAESGRVIGAPAPAFAFADLNGKTLSSGELRGRIVLVNFWATWCAPCREEIPMLNRLRREYRARGVEFVGIAADNAQAVKQFIASIPIDYTVLIGGADSLDLVNRYGNRTGTLPFTAFITRDGTVGAAAGGKLTEAYTRMTLDKLLLRADH